MTRLNPVFPLFFFASFFSLSVANAQPSADRQLQREEIKVKTFLYHQVADFGQWKAAFDAAYDKRTAAGELSYAVGTFHHRPDVAYVISEWISADAFRAFLADPAQEAFLQEAGILETPQTVILNKMEASTAIPGKITAMAYYEVEEAGRWRTAFHEAAAVRAIDGEISYEIGTFHENPRVVYILSEWPTIEDFQAHMLNPALEVALFRGGIKPPAFTLLFDEVASSRHLLTGLSH